MDARSFWQLPADVCQLGEFIAAMQTKGAEINIVGTLQAARDGLEMVLEKQDCRDHFHITPEEIRAFHFRHCEVITGGNAHIVHEYINTAPAAKGTVSVVRGKKKIRALNRRRRIVDGRLTWVARLRFLVPRALDPPANDQRLEASANARG